MIRPGGLFRRFAPALIAALALSACASKSERTESFFQQYSQALIANGKLRQEKAPEDAPFTNADLERISWKSRSLTSSIKRMRRSGRQSRSANWNAPIRYAVIGQNVTEKDRADIMALAVDLEAATGLAISEGSEDTNFLIAILDEGERRVFTRLISEKLGESFASFPQKWDSFAYSDCIAQLLLVEDGPRCFAIAMIKNEVQGLYRTSCIHEEIVQSFGLTNDGPEVRPSLFNDDQEFALMTEHDEYLLRILYDDRVKFGMTGEELRPLLPAIIADLRPEARHDPRRSLYDRRLRAGRLLQHRGDQSELYRDPANQRQASHGAGAGGCAFHQSRPRPQF